MSYTKAVLSRGENSMDRLNFNIRVISFNERIFYRILEEEFNGSRKEYVGTTVCRICHQRKG